MHQTGVSSTKEIAHIENQITPPAQVNTSNLHGVAREKNATASVVKATSPQATIMNATNLAKAIQQAHAEYGETNSVLYAENFAAMACARDPDPNGTISSHTPDPLRAWAISKWLQQCQGMSNLQHIDGKIVFSSPAKIAKDQGVEAGIQAAMQTLQTSDEIPELDEAGQLLIENGQLQKANIPGLDPNLGAPDLFRSWVFAAELWSCDQSGGCGPNNFRTVNYCSVAGCPPDSDFRSALNASLSVRDMQAVNALYQWIAHVR
jgi:hypothetical protein